MMTAIERRLKEAEEQAAFWRGKAAEAERQAVMWEGAALALRGVREELLRETVADGGTAGGGDDDYLAGIG